MGLFNLQMEKVRVDAERAAAAAQASVTPVAASAPVVTAPASAPVTPVAASAPVVTAPAGVTVAPGATVATPASPSKETLFDRIEHAVLDAIHKAEGAV